MRIDILTIFPEMFAGVFDSSIVGKTREAGKVDLVLHNIRDQATDVHKTVDDSPYGGGPGMVMKADVLAAAVKAVPKVGKSRKVVLLTPAGEGFSQGRAKDFSGLDQLVLVCGRYEGIDERFIELYIDLELSVGDYVVSGGEIPAMLVIEAVVRLIPGVLGNEESLKSESHTNGLLEYPQYTRPPEFGGLKVPEVLLSGNHKKIDEWREKLSIERTKERRPDLLKKN